LSIATKLDRATTGSAVITSKSGLYVYSTTDTSAPLAIVLAGNGADVAAVLKICHDEEIQISVRGSGTSVQNASLAGSVMVVTTQMNNILEINHKCGYARVEAGVTCAELSRTLEKQGFFCPSIRYSPPASTVAGGIIKGLSHPRPCYLKHKSVRGHVLGYRLALADGTFLEETTPLPDMAGYDLFAYSVANFCVIIELYLHIQPLPDCYRSVLIKFREAVDATTFFAKIARNGTLLSKLEQNGLCYLMELEGSRNEIDEQFSLLANVAQTVAVRELVMAQDNSQNAKLRQEFRSG
jgi:glycolate oxidase